MLAAAAAAASAARRAIAVAGPRVAPTAARFSSATVTLPPMHSVRRRVLSAVRLPFAAPTALFASASCSPLLLRQQRQQQQRRSVSSYAPTPKEHGYERIEEVFGVNCFSAATMRELLPSHVWEAVERSRSQNQPIDDETAEAVANVLLAWAMQRGATHYTHWFQPMTGATAQKHDAFLKRHKDGRTISLFRGKDLVKGEPDASSFPNGGLRETHMARGYTVWDPSSPPFVIDHGNGATLYIPSIFFSQQGHNLDEKIPLLRSIAALSRETLRLLRLAGESGHKQVHTDSGVEQEFFIIDREMYLKRPDLMLTGRTLLGAAPPKGQELEDQYFGDISERALRCIQDAQSELWKLGIPVTTRHREVAPGQYEVAPVFSQSMVASDQNLTLMEVLSKVAKRHGLQILFHEKPFLRVNGSGKHNNWSVGTDRVPTLFQPGDKPAENMRFMLMLAATLRAVDTHADLLRIAISGASNDHRLGANEAPPAIMSVFLGDVAHVVHEFVHGVSGSKNVQRSALDVGVQSLPDVQLEITDRNRTSPFAFTGNKFEFRAVGASQPPSRSNMILNTILADAVRAIADEIEADTKKASGSPLRERVFSIIRENLRKHERIVFNGNNYSAEWRQEAARRGLPNYATTPLALEQTVAPKNLKLFESLGVMSSEELGARSNIMYDEYVKKICVESRVLTSMVLTSLVPSISDYQLRIAGAITAVSSAAGAVAPEALAPQKKLLAGITGELASLIETTRKLEDETKAVSKIDVHHDAALACEKLLPIMLQVRKHCDALESVVDAKSWPFPTYHQMLFHQD